MKPTSLYACRSVHIITYSGGAGKFHLGAIAHRVCETEVSIGVQGRSPGRRSEDSVPGPPPETETEINYRFWLQKAIKICKFHAIHLLILDHHNYIHIGGRVTFGGFSAAVTSPLITWLRTWWRCDMRIVDKITNEAVKHDICRRGTELDDKVVIS